MIKYIEIKIGTQSFQILLEDPPELLPLNLNSCSGQDSPINYALIF